MTKFFSMIAALVFAASILSAQDQADDISWVQIEAHPSLSATESRLRDFAGQLQDVAGFSMGAGWYGIALGPYRRADAEQVLRTYRAQGIIPRDSYITTRSDYRQQIWPVGAGDLSQPQAEPAPATQPEPTVAVVDPEPEPEPQILASDETPAEARRSERDLDRAARQELQIALKWAGHYNSSIDGAFGQGTRRAMADWQRQNAYEPTGILTTLQRADLLRQYNAVLEGLNLQVVADAGAGIEMKLPLGVVAFDKYVSPFAFYEATGDIPARVLLISQSGDQDTLFGLYDILQTLDIVPEDGPRERKSDRFTLIGEGADFISQTEARLIRGEIKGFTLIWPAGDEERRTRLLGEMQGSFASIDGVLDPTAGADDTQSVDLVSGLEIRKPKLSRSGFYVDRSGIVVTTVDAVQSCGRISLDETHDATVIATSGQIAVLRPDETLAPQAFAALQLDTPRLSSEVAVSGYSYGGILSAPTLTYGQLADLKGLNGEPSLKRLALGALDGDAGGPVFDAAGAVMGILLPKSTSGRALPEEVSFALDAEALSAVLVEAGVAPNATSDSGQIAPEDLIKRATGMTVLVSCWD